MSTPIESQPLVKAAVRAAVKEAGHNPDSTAGDALYAWGLDQVAKGGRVPTAKAMFERAQEFRLSPQPVEYDADHVERQIAAAREAGDFHTASMLQSQVDRVRNAPGGVTFTEEETAAITAARERAEAVEGGDLDAVRERREAWAEASRLESAAIRRMQAGTPTGPPEPHPTFQPTGGFTETQRALLDGDDPIDDRIAAAQAAGEHMVASMLQSQTEGVPA